jgi:hypothetical protein
MIMQSASKLRLLEMSSNVFVRHFLQTGLKEIIFLTGGSAYMSTIIDSHLSVPHLRTMICFLRSEPSFDLFEGRRGGRPLRAKQLADLVGFACLSLLDFANEASSVCTFQCKTIRCRVLLYEMESDNEVYR